jgi:hypothetical protein
VRRLKADVLTQLPPKRRECVRLELEAGAAADMAARAADIKAAFARAGAAERNAAAGDARGARDARHAAQREMSAWWHASALAKASAAAAYVAELLEGGAKLLVFAHHAAVLDALEEAVRASRVGYIRMDGSTPSRERHAAVARFQADASVRCALLSVTACGQGITLTASSEVVFCELCWTPAVLLQAEDRAHRLGQRAAVNIRYLVAPGTVDDVMWPLISRKLRCLGRALDGRAAGLELSQRAEEADGPPGTAADAADDDDVVIIEDGADGGSMMDEAGALLCGGGAGGAGLGTAPRVAPPKPLDGEDIRSFFGGGAAAKRRKSDADGAPSSSQPGGSQEAAAAARGWDCLRCTLRNARNAARCDACDAPRPSAAQRLAHTAATAAPAAAGPSAEPTATPLPPAADADAAPDAASLQFEVSPHTGRVFLHRGGAFTGDSFAPEELEVLAAAEAERDADGGAATAGGDEADGEPRLPPALRGATALRQARHFVREWAALRAVTQKALCATLLRPPLAAAAAAAAAGVKRARAPQEGAADGAAGGSKNRFSTMERFLAPPCAAAAASAVPAAADAGAAAPGAGTAEEVRSWAAADGRLVRQRFAGGAPLCLHCGEAYDDAVRLRLGTACCGAECAAALRVLTQSGAARAQLRALERGACQLCGLDTLRLLHELRALPTAQERARRLRAHGWGERRAAAAADAPAEGQLWQADHALAVAEGGGEADLSAYRTLCDPCHLRETAALRGRLRDAQFASAAQGAPDIRTLFGAPR